MSTLEDHMRRELRRFIVQKHIFCPITGTVLDMDESVFINDADGDPALALSQEGWQRIVDAEAPLSPGYVVDESTVHPA